MRVENKLSCIKISSNKVLHQNIESKVADQGETRTTDRKVAKYLLYQLRIKVKLNAIAPAGIKVTDSKILKLISIVLS